MKQYNKLGAIIYFNFLYFSNINNEIVKEVKLLKCTPNCIHIVHIHTKEVNKMEVTYHFCWEEKSCYWSCHIKYWIYLNIINDNIFHMKLVQYSSKTIWI